MTADVQIIIFTDGASEMFCTYISCDMHVTYLATKVSGSGTGEGSQWAEYIYIICQRLYFVSKCTVV